MKRFLLFYGLVYYPSQGMGDFHSDHDTRIGAYRTAIAHVRAKDQCELHELTSEYKYVVIYDTTTRMEVLNTED